MAKTETIHEVLSFLKSAFPGTRFAARDGAVWSRLLADVDDDRLLEAAETIAMSRKWFPSIAELREAAASSGPEPGSRVDLLAAERSKLETRAAAGDFHRGDWVDLTERFATAGRVSAAEAIMKRGEGLEKPPSAATRKRYAECVEELRGAEG